MNEATPPSSRMALQRGQGQIFFTCVRVTYSICSNVQCSIDGYNHQTAWVDIYIYIHAV